MNRERQRRQCPEHCPYRRGPAPFCGYCMMKIIQGKSRENEKEAEHDSRQKQTEDTEQIDG